MGDHPIPFTWLFVILFIGMVCLGAGASIAYSRVESGCAEKGHAVLTETVSINCEVKKWTP